MIIFRGVRELKWKGGLDQIFSPTKSKSDKTPLCGFLSSCLSVSLYACLFAFLPFYLPYALSSLPIFLLFHIFRSFFMEIYSPTPFRVWRQGGLLNPLTPLPRRPWTQDGTKLAQLSTARPSKETLEEQARFFQPDIRISAASSIWFLRRDSRPSKTEMAKLTNNPLGRTLYISMTLFRCVHASL